jgi:hypothetical protein
MVSAWWMALKTGAVKILIAGLTLLPGLLAYVIYGVFIADKLPLTKLAPVPRYWRIFCEVAGGLLAAFIIAYGFGQSCPQDDDGYCLDDDWKAPGPAALLASFMRLSLLILGGMAFAYSTHKRKNLAKYY